MQFLQLIEFFLGVIGIVYRKEIRYADSPSLAEIFNAKKQGKISTSTGS